MSRQTAPLHVVEKPSLCRVPEEASIVSYSLCARQPSFHLLAFNIAYNIILDFILKSNPLMQKLKKKFQFLEPSLKDAGHLWSTRDALLLKGLFALCAAQMITVMVSRRSEKRINLQQQAQAIYSSMFIDNPDPAWSHGHLSDLITVKYGKDHKKLADGIYPVYGSGGIMRYVERPLYNKESVLIPRKGTLNNVMYVNQPFWSVDTMFYTEMKLPNVAKFVYHFVKAKDLASMNAGSAVPSMTTDILNAMEVVIPSASALEEFESLVAPMYEAMEANDVQSKALSQIRDTLLPKLMSGEIDVSDVQL